MKDNFKDFTKSIISLAAGFGLITGLVEGVLLFGLHQFEWLTWRLQNRAYWYETLWIAPLVDVILFSLAGLALALIGFPLRKKFPVTKISLFLFSVLAAVDWLFIILFGKISLVAILVLAAGLGVQSFTYFSKREGADFEISSAVCRGWLALRWQCSWSFRAAAGLAKK